MTDTEPTNAPPTTPAPLLDIVDDWSQTLKILADPTRFKLLLILHYQGPGQMTMTELAHESDLRPATASAALRYMSNVGVVNVKRDGRQMYYYLADERTHRMLHYMGSDCNMHHDDDHAEN